jgi:ProP effector
MHLDRKLVDEAYAKLAERWPDCFDLKRPKPLAIGIHTAIIESGVLDAATCSIVLRCYVSGKRYLCACTAPDAMRIDLDGQPVAPVSERDANSSRKSLAALLVRQRNKRLAREAEAKAAQPVVVAEAPREPGRKPLLTLRRKAA